MVESSVLQPRFIAKMLQAMAIVMRVVRVRIHIQDQQIVRMTQVSALRCR